MSSQSNSALNTASERPYTYLISMNDFGPGSVQGNVSSNAAQGRTQGVEPLLDAEYEEYTRLQYTAFRSSGGISTFIFPSGLPADAMRSIVEKGQKKMHEKENAYYAKVVDQESRQIVAIAHWKLFTSERTAEEQQALERTRTPLPGVNLLAWRDYYGHVQDSRCRLGTRPCLTVHVFATHPAHRRNGHGAMLLEHILRQADEHCLETYLEASEQGKRLYAKYSFQAIYEKEFNLARYGGSGADRNTIMMRPAQRPSDATIERTAGAPPLNNTSTDVRAAGIV
ncbi:hypothetical protein BU25DRAFT_418953 [Macroventuria anomochaeta]|uniref:Uncharacterized protein n=1 Tax=Macroventuria anomochaeta TaxID=301207 RepID=A0ACB6SAG2_9PLEO|nr:uncharacterized protein BU25DRAFT_418953 [Macroventuria anomochaeta]KAF2630580.1 hypothetical protein BU25DRAFT_418953 [Macroventuria anomochaeta]